MSLSGTVEGRLDELSRVSAARTAEAASQSKARLDLIHDSVIDLGRHLAAIDNVLHGSLWAAESQTEYRLLADMAGAVPAGEAAQKGLQQLEVAYARIEEDMAATKRVVGKASARLKLLEETVLTNAANLERILQAFPAPDVAETP